MTNQNLYDAALQMVCEVATEGENDDYKERAGYLLASVCSQCLELDKKYRKAHGLPECSFSVTTQFCLTDDFPLSDIFVPGAIYYLASLLVIDENEVMSERFFDLYSDAMSKIESELPMSVGKIQNRYRNLI